MTIELLNEAWHKKWSDLDFSNFRNYDDAIWLRFHTLPSSKRTPTTDEELDTVLGRHHALLTGLCKEGTPLLLITTTWHASKNDLHMGDPGVLIDETPTPWRAFEDTSSQLKVQKVSLNSAALKSNLTQIARDEAAGTIVAPLSLEWLYHPYDGGVDILIPSDNVRQTLRDKYSGWLSSRADGL
jgi:hypothetical protein